MATEYNPVSNGARYIPPPAVPDAQWAAAVANQYGAPQAAPSLWQRMMQAFSNERGAVELPRWIGGGGTAGQAWNPSVEGVLAPSELTPATQPSIIRQLLGQQQARLTAGAPQAALEAGSPQLALNAGSGARPMGPMSMPPEATAWNNVGAQAQMGLPSGPTLELPAGTSATRTFAMPAAGETASARTFAMPASTAAAEAPVAGGIGAFGPGFSGQAAGAAEAAGGAGLAAEAAGAAPSVAQTLGQAYGSGGITGLGKGLWGMTGGVKGMVGRGAIALPAMLAAQYIGAPVVGGVANMIAPGTGGAASDAVKDMASNAALGFTVAGPIGGIAGELYGGAKAIAPLASELYHDIQGDGVAQQWGKATGAFNKAIVKTGKLDKDTRDAINKGFVDQTTGKWVPGIYQQAQDLKKMAEDGKVSHEQAVTMMNKLTDQLKVINYQSKQQKKATTTQASQDAANSLVIADAMNKYGSQVVDSGDAMAASIRAQIPNVSPQLAPLMEADAAQRAAFGRQLQAGYAAAALAQPTIARMDAQLQAMQQAAAAQQLAAAQARAAAQAGSGSSGKSFADIANGK